MLLQRAAFLLIRLVAIFLGAQAIHRGSQQFAFEGSFIWWRVLIPHALLAVIALLLWAFADSLAKVLARDAAIWFPPSEDEIEDEPDDEEPSWKMEHLLIGALVVSGVLLAAFGIVSLANTITSVFADPIGTFRFEGPSALRLALPGLVAGWVEFMLGLFLIFSPGPIVRAAERARDWYTMEQLAADYDDEEDEDEQPPTWSDA